LKSKILEGFYNKYRDNKPYNFNIEKLIIIKNGEAIQLTRNQIEKNMFEGLKQLNTKK
jgi:hypothetical protein